MNIILNGENLHLDDPQTVAGLLSTLGFDERNQASFMSNPRMRYGATAYDEMMNDGEQTSITYVGDFDNFNVVFN